VQVGFSDEKMSLTWVLQRPTRRNRVQHESEWVYSTALSRTLHDANRYIHGIESLAHPVEFAVFLCGYAFNPVMVPVWAGLVFCYASSSAVFATLFYLSTVLVTLLATETCMALISATRPERILGDAYRVSRLRRYGTLVSSLKSKHSFPSGDCAQAANLCFVLCNPEGFVGLSCRRSGLSCRDY
jgi:hypothetical protein